MGSSKVLLTTIASLVAFAANSLLARAALSGTAIDAVTFTGVRLISGAAVLWLVAGWRKGRWPREGSWISAAALFVYALAFSWAYLTLSAGTGALILFGAVQLTMIGWGLRVGERLKGGQWIGLFLAVGGLGYLLSPGLEAPDPVGAVLMAASGVGWGIYSLRGRGAQQPILVTAGNFLRSVPFAAAAMGGMLAWGQMPAAPTGEGILLAVISGAVTSGLGYVIWYLALGGLTASVAGIVQLAVPVLAALGGVAFLGEALTLRLAVAGAVILAGIALASRASPRDDSGSGS